MKNMPAPFAYRFSVILTRRWWALATVLLLSSATPLLKPNLATGSVLLPAFNQPTKAHPKSAHSIRGAARQCPVLTITPASLPAGMGGIAYQQTLAASGGTTPYSFTNSGNFPTGLTLTPEGVITGVPFIAGTYNFAVTVTDINGCTGMRDYTIGVTVSVNPQSGILYSLLDDSTSNRVLAFAIDETTGTLALLPGFPVETGGRGTGFVDHPQRITIDRANKRLYVINRNSNTVSAFAITPATGLLTPLPFSPIDLGAGFWDAIAVHPSGSPLLVSQDNETRLASYRITATTATPAAGSPYTINERGATDIVFSQDGNYVYTGATNFLTRNIAGLSVNPGTGVLTALAGSPYDTRLIAPAFLGTDTAGRIILANSTAAVLQIFTTNNGIPQAVTGNPFIFGLRNIQHGLLHPAGFYLADDEANQNLNVFRISGNGSETIPVIVEGSPFALPRSRDGSGARGFAFNHAGTFLFVSTTLPRSYSTYSFNTTTGALVLRNTVSISQLGGSAHALAYLPPATTQCSTIALSPSSLPDGVIGTTYNQALTASPAGSYTFAITSGTLPAGLSLNTATGTITGTPTTAGTTNFTITAANAGNCSSSQAYTLTIVQPNPAPMLTSLDPNTRVTGSAGFTLTLNGNGFIPASQVKWNGADRLTSFVNNTRLTINITAGDVAAPGTATLTVTNPVPGGGVSNALPFQITSPNPAPALTGLTPNMATAGGLGFTLTVTGTNFINGCAVRWNNADRPTTFVSTTQLTVQIPASDLVTAGTASVTVFNPTPGGGVSNTQTFTINNPVPTLTALNPNAATAGSAAFTLTITGTNFINSSVVRWNGNDRPTAFVSNTQLTAALSATELASAGTASVTVFNPTPGGGASNTQTFTTNNPAPTLAALNPNSATAGSAAFTLTLTGTNFVNGSVVRWNGNNRPTTLASATQLTAQIPASDLVAPGTASVSVLSPAPGGGASGVLSFTVGNPTPTLSTLNPNSATAGSAAFTLTLTGTNFVNGAVIRWNGSERVTSFSNNTQLTAAIPASDLAAAGTANVTVFNPTPGGGVSIPQLFTINNLTPTSANLTPSLVTAGGAAFTLTVNGGNFGNDSVVRWNGSNRTTTFISGTRLTAAIPATDIATAGTARVIVFTPTPGGGTSNELTVTIANAVASVSAASFSAAALAPESIVAAFGTNLATNIASSNAVPLPTTLAGTMVRVRDNSGTERLAPLFFVAPQQLNFLVPPGTAPGVATLTVTSGNGIVSIGNVTIAAVAPGLFTANANGQGVPTAVAVRVKPDGTQNFELIARFDEQQQRFVAVPLDLGPLGEQVLLVLFGTGLRGRSALGAVTTAIGGVNADVLFAGAQGDLVGLDQVNVAVPRTLAGRGEVDIVLAVDGRAANTVRVNLK